MENLKTEGKAFSKSKMKTPMSTKKIIAPKEIPSFFGKEITGLSK